MTALSPVASAPAVFDVQTPLARARISLFGGQVLEWQPKAAPHPVLWLSPLASLDGSRAIRGGVPICWPWFGAHPTSHSLPAHGLARLRTWRLEHTRVDTDGTTEVRLALDLSPTSAVDAPARGLQLAQTIRIGKTLSIALETRNGGAETRLYSEGLHTYFRIGDIETVRVEGLDGATYVDLTAGNARDRQQGAVEFPGETARLFVGTSQSCVIVDPTLKRRLRVDKSGSASTAIWNPGRDVAVGMSDLGDPAWRDMVCVETANALDDSPSIAPGETRVMTAQYSLEPLD